MAVLLTESDVADLICMSDAITLTEQYYLANAASLARYHSPVRLKIPNGSLRVTAGALLADQVMGARVGPASGLRGDATIMSLFDADSGVLLAVLGYPFSILRTGANVGLAAKWLSCPDSSSAALIGAGRNSLSLLRGIAEVLPVTRVTVYSRRAENREQFARDVAAEFGAIDVRVADSPANAVAGADMVVCATNSPVPVFDAGDVGPDVFVASMGSPAELPPDLLTSSAVFVGSWPQELQYDHYHSYREDVPPRLLVRLVADGTLRWGTEVRQLDDAIAGNWERPAGGRVVFKESQGGCSDVALAAAAYRKAIDLGRGRHIDFTR
jgi:ornithine cyclodeaminase/alanine dehydrogenase-like protein (mu-crystallin family)